MNRPVCGCPLHHQLSTGQSLARAFVNGFTWGAFPRDYPARERREYGQRIHHLLTWHSL